MRLSISKRNSPEETSCLFAPPERGDLQWRDETVRAAEKLARIWRCALLHPKLSQPLSRIRRRRNFLRLSPSRSALEELCSARRRRPVTQLTVRSSSAAPLPPPFFFFFFFLLSLLPSLLHLHSPSSPLRATLLMGLYTH